MFIHLLATENLTLIFVYTSTLRTFTHNLVISDTNSNQNMASHIPEIIFLHPRGFKHEGKSTLTGSTILYLIIIQIIT